MNASGSGMSTGVAAELFLSSCGRWLSGIMRGILDAEAAAGRSCPYSGTKVAGGLPSSPQERYLTALERVDRKAPPAFIRLSRHILGLEDGELGDYISGIVGGKDGWELGEELGLSAMDRKAFQSWLVWALEDSGIPLRRIGGKGTGTKGGKRAHVAKNSTQGSTFSERGTRIPDESKKSNTGQPRGGKTPRRTAEGDKNESSGI